MSTVPTLSIVIPALNEEVFLPKLLNDLSKQVEHNFEVIVVDGNSADKTKENAVKFSGIFPLHIYSVNKRNVSFQRNYGGKTAKGSLICFMDADARIDNDFTQKIATHSLTGELFIPTLRSDTDQFIARAMLQFTNSFVQFAHFMRRPMSAGGCLCISKQLFVRLGGFNEKLFMSEDHNLVKRAYKLGVHPVILHDVKVVFSLRRIEKEGMAIFLYKNLYAFFDQLAKGETKNAIFAYEMGGEGYKSKPRP